MTQACTPLSEKRLFLLDMDGTLYLGDRLFEATPAFLQCIRDKGGRYLFLTNNSSRGVDAYIEKMNCFGIKTEADDYLTSTDATIVYLKHHHAGQLIFAVGTASFCRQLIQAGIRLTDDIADNPDVLVLAYDTELTYRKLTDATRLLLRGIPYIATNPDLVCPTDFGSVPDCGSFAGMLRNATGRMPHFIGKPEPDMIRLAIQRASCAPVQTLLVGDRLYTDIASGARAGIDTVLVLSGEATAEDARTADPPATYVMRDVGELRERISVPGA